MRSTKLIRISEKTYKELENKGRFGETFESVIRRILMESSKEKEEFFDNKRNPENHHELQVLSALIMTIKKKCLLTKFPAVADRRR